MNEPVTVQLRKSDQGVKCTAVFIDGTLVPVQSAEMAFVSDYGKLVLTFDMHRVNVIFEDA